MKLPKGWKPHELGHYIRGLEAGVSVNGDDEPAQGEQPGVLKVSAISNGRFLPQNNKRIVANEISRARVKPKAGSIIISRSNTALLVADSAYVSHDIEHCFLSDKLWQTIFDEASPCSAQWLAAVLQSKRVRTQLIRLATGTSGSMKNISKEAFLALEVPSPPLPEQRKIADILTTWDEALTQLDALIEAQERRKKALMQQLLTGKKRFPGFKGKWKKVALGDVAENVADQNKGRMGTTSLYGVTKAEGMVPMRNHVKGESFDRCKRVETDWFAYNPMRINIGSIARWQGAETVMVSGDYVVFRCHPDKILPAYLEHLRQSWMWQSFVTRGGNGSVRIRIYFSDLAEFTFPCPPIEEQRQIAAILDTADQQLTLLRAQLSALDQQKRGLMQRLLTGKLRVKT